MKFRAICAALAVLLAHLQAEPLQGLARGQGVRFQALLAAGEHGCHQDGGGLVGLLGEGAQVAAQDRRQRCRQGFAGCRHGQAFELSGAVVEGGAQGKGPGHVGAGLRQVAGERFQGFGNVQQLLEFGATDALGNAQHRP